MKITARVESPSPMSRRTRSPTPPVTHTPPQQNMSLLNLPESSIIPKKLTDDNNNDESCRNILSPTKSPARMTDIFKNESTKDRIEGSSDQRVTSPTPFKQRMNFGVDSEERVKSPTQFLNISRGLQSPTPTSLTNTAKGPEEKDSEAAGTYQPGPATSTIPFRRIQSPLQFLVKSPNSLSPRNGSAESLGEGKSFQNNTSFNLAGSHLLNDATTKASIRDEFGFVCDELSNQEREISRAPEIKIKSLSQEVIKYYSTNIPIIGISLNIFLLFQGEGNNLFF